MPVRLHPTELTAVTVFVTLKFSFEIIADLMNFQLLISWLFLYFRYCIVSMRERCTFAQ